MPRFSKAEREKAITDLRDILKPGDTVYTIMRQVSSSGMSRDIDCQIIVGGEPRWLSYLVAKATGFPFNEKRDAIRVGGCGMDMGFHLVYTLSRVLFPDGHDCIGKSETHDKSCPSNDHSNDRSHDPVLYSPDRRHRDGGYALRHRWL